MTINVDKLEFYVVMPQYGVNLLKNPHPQTTNYFAKDTGANFGLASTLAAPYNTYSRRGADCLYFEPSASTTLGVTTGADLTGGSTYTFSVDVLTTAGEPMVLQAVTMTGWTLISQKLFTASGNWERQSLTFTNPSTDKVYVYVRRTSSSANSYYVFTDGWQLEAGTRATTFIIGDEPGFGEGEYYWEGEPYNSSSVRSGVTRHGGYLLKLSDYAMISAAPGLGMGKFNQIMTDVVSGGALYQDYIRSPRQFSLVFEFKGTDTRDLHNKRRTLINALRPDFMGGGQPLVLRYQGFDENDVEATQPIDIECVMVSGLEEIPSIPTYHKDVVVFKVPDGHLRGAFKQGSLLELYQTLSQVNYIVKRSSAGAWSELGVDGLNGAVYAFAEHPSGYVFVGGAFTNAGGVSGADRIAKYNPWTNTWSAVVTGCNGDVKSLAVDASGNLYVGGAFTDLGSVAAADRIAKITNPTAVSPTVTALGSGIGNGTVYAVGIQPNTGYLYVGGSFTDAGGVAAADRIGKYVPATNTWSALGSGLNATVYAIDFNPWGTPYIGGSFTNAVSSGVGNYFVYWSGTVFVRPSTFQPNATVRALEYVSGRGIYLGGDFTAVTGSSGTIANSRYAVLWNGVNWSSLSTGPNDLVYALRYDTQTQSLYAGGIFTSVGSLTATDKIAVWKQGAWSVIDADLPVYTGNAVWSLFVSRFGMLYIGGIFAGTATTGKAATTTENNVGSANTYPELTVTGPGDLKALINFSTGKRINFNGLLLQAGETITINLDPTNLKMTSSWSGRRGLMATIAAGSDHGDFFLNPGSNTIQLYMPTNTTAATKGWLSWIPKYWSIEGAVNV